MWFRVIGGCGIVLLIFLLKGCGSATQIGAPNRKVLEALQTAVSSKKVEWLDAVATQVDEKHEHDEISDDEFAAIDGIIQKAKSGDWKGAQKDCFALSDGQRPTSDDLEIVKERKRADVPVTK